MCLQQLVQRPCGSTTNITLYEPYILTSRSCRLPELQTATPAAVAAAYLQCDAADDARHWQALVHCRVVGVKLAVPAADSSTGNITAASKD
jgi:hypothetical protein